MRAQQAGNLRLRQRQLYAAAGIKLRADGDPETGRYADAVIQRRGIKKATRELLGGFLISRCRLNLLHVQHRLALQVIPKFDHVRLRNVG